MDTSESELHALVERARGADPDAWETLYRRVYARLFTYARRRVASEALAEDAVSETMIRAMDGIGGFVWTGAGIDGWLVGIVRNVVYETYRDGARTTPTDPASVPEPGDDVSDPLEEVVRDEEGVLVMTAFERLPAADQSCSRCEWSRV